MYDFVEVLRIYFPHAALSHKDLRISMTWQGSWASWVSSYLVLSEVGQASEMSVQYWMKSDEAVACEMVEKGRS